MKRYDCFSDVNQFLDIELVDPIVHSGVSILPQNVYFFDHKCAVYKALLHTAAINEFCYSAIFCPTNSAQDVAKTWNSRISPI